MNNNRACAILVAVLIVASAVIMPATAVGTDGAGLRSGTASADGISVSYIDSITEGYGVLSISYDQEPKGTYFNVIIDGRSTVSFDKANLERLLIEGGLSTGAHTISVRSDADGTHTVTLMVGISVTSISVDRTEVAIKKGESLELKATVSPADATDKTVSWSSSNPAVVTVSAYGVVNAVGPGTAVVTAKVGDKTASCAVSVTVDVSSVQLNLTERSLKTGESFTLVATVLPSDATDKTVSWSSSNLAVASVSNNGTVRAIGVGSAVITAAVGGFVSTCIVTVTSNSVPSDSTVTEKVNEDGSKTVTIEKQTINQDGTRVESKTDTTTSADGNSVSVVQTLTVKDGSGDVISNTNTISKVTKGGDGTRTETTKTEVSTSDGTILKTESEKKVATDGQVTETRKLTMTDSTVSTDASASIGADGTVNGASVIAVSAPSVKTEGKAEYRIDSEVSSTVIGHMDNVRTLVGDVVPTIKLIADDTSKMTEFTVSAQLMNRMSESNGILEVSSSNGIISMDHETITSLVSEDGDMTVQISDVDKSSDLSSEQRNKVGTNTVVEMMVIANGTEIHDFGGSVTVSIPYELPDGMDPSDVSAWYLDDDGSLTDMAGQYDPENGLVIFTTTHFSMYVVGIMNDDAGTTGHGDNLLLIIVAIIVALLLAMVIFVYLRKRMGAE